MNVEKSLVFDCTDCGSERQLVINNVKRGFFDTGWQAIYSQGNQPAFICDTCVPPPTSVGLQKQKEYLDHIFEAQWRFGE